MTAPETDVVGAVDRLKSLTEGLLRRLDPNGAGGDAPSAVVVAAVQDVARQVADARREADRIVREAEQAARQRVEEARAQVAAELAPELGQVQSSIDELRARRSDLLTILRSFDETFRRFADDVATVSAAVGGASADLGLATSARSTDEANRATDTGTDTGTHTETGAGAATDG